MSDRTCKTCKWWNVALRQEDYDADMARRDPSDAWKPVAGMGYCYLDKPHVVTIHQRGFCEERNEMMTAPDFGCNQWESGEP